jgi:hypothetical protein
MTPSKYPVSQIESDGTRCKFYSMGNVRDGWIMPDGVGVDYAGYAQIRFEPEEIATDDAEGLRRSRTAVANQQFSSENFGCRDTEAEDWIEAGDSLVRICYANQGKDRVQMDFQVSFCEGSARPANTSVFNITAALVDDAEWAPMFTPWRGGGWYVSNVRYPNGSTGCVSNKFADKKWRIVCDPRRGNLGDVGDFTFKSRTDAAEAERELARHQARMVQAKRASALAERPHACSATINVGAQVGC